MPSAFDGYYPDGYDDGDQSGTHAGKQPRMVNCEACQTEGRILTNDGGPDDVDHGVCPECNGERVVEVETEPMTEAEFYEKMFAVGHKADCNWTWDQYWWECNCGLIPVEELKAEKARRGALSRS